MRAAHRSSVPAVAPSGQSSFTRTCSRLATGVATLAMRACATRACAGIGTNSDAHSNAASRK